MVPSQQQLLRRILSSPYFAQANALQRILQYVCEHAEDENPGALKEYEIAVQSLGRHPNFDPKIDPIVRVSVAGIRERLRSYFENEGSGETLQLTIPKGAYRPVFTGVQAAELAATPGAARASALRAFWGSHLAAGGSNVLVYTELLFFRDPRGNYLRNIYVNRLPEGMSGIRERFPLPEETPLRPSYHFLSAGEVYSLLSLLRVFSTFGVPLDLKNSRFCSWNDLQHANLILLGSARTNPFSDSLQSGGNFIINDERIENRSPLPREEPFYAGRRYMEGKLERVTEYALVTRRPGLLPGTTITMIAANHGRAIEGAGQFLSLEDKVEGLLAATGFGTRVPDQFQVLLRVEMLDFDEEVMEVNYVTHRVTGTGFA